jgi:hypothetical protein
MLTAAVRPPPPCPQCRHLSLTEGVTLLTSAESDFCHCAACDYKWMALKVAPPGAKFPIVPIRNTSPG